MPRVSMSTCPRAPAAAQATGSSAGDAPTSDRPSGAWPLPSEAANARSFATTTAKFPSLPPSESEGGQTGISDLDFVCRMLIAVWNGRRLPTARVPSVATQGDSQVL